MALPRNARLETQMFMRLLNPNELILHTPQLLFPFLFSLYYLRPEGSLTNQGHSLNRIQDLRYAILTSHLT